MFSKLEPHLKLLISEKLNRIEKKLRRGPVMEECSYNICIVAGRGIG